MKNKIDKCNIIIMSHIIIIVGDKKKNFLNNKSNINWIKVKLSRKWLDCNHIIIKELQSVKCFRKL